MLALIIYLRVKLMIFFGYTNKMQRCWLMVNFFFYLKKKHNNHLNDVKLLFKTTKLNKKKKNLIFKQRCLGEIFTIC